MSMTSTLSAAAGLSGDGTSGTFTPRSSPIVNPNSPGPVPEKVVLAPGDNVFAVPPGAMWLIVDPPTSSSNAKTIRWAGATGQPIAPAVFGVYPILAGTVNVTINSVAAETIQLCFG